MENKIPQYCQKCLAANKPGDSSCTRCGSPLMLVVFPPSIRHSDTITPSFYEDHLLERVSLLELRLAQVSETLMMAMDIIREQGQMIRDEHKTLRNLYQALETVGLKDKNKVGKSQAPIDENKTFEINAEQIEAIFNYKDSKNSDVLIFLLREGIKFLEQNDEMRAFAAFERAVQNAPKNALLNIFFAENLFFADKFDFARKKLETAEKLEPSNEKIKFLLGAIYADEGHVEKARQYLNYVANNQNAFVCRKFIQAMLYAFEKNWLAAKAILIEILESQSSPEINYLNACVLFQIKDFQQALFYLKKTLSDDEKYADAWFMQNVIYVLLNDFEQARRALKTAIEAGENGAQCLEFFKNENSLDMKLALPFQHFEKAPKRVLTGGSLRLRKLFRSLVIQTLPNFN